VIDEVELDLQVDTLRMHQGRGQAAGGHVQGHLPPVIDHGLKGQPNLPTI
jgi:hypothetical protein